MAFEEATQELICPNCTATHLARWSRMPVKEEVMLRCIACGGTLLQGKTNRDYFDLQLGTN